MCIAVGCVAGADRVARVFRPGVEDSRTNLGRRYIASADSAAVMHVLQDVRVDQTVRRLAPAGLLREITRPCQGHRRIDWTKTGARRPWATWLGMSGPSLASRPTGTRSLRPRIVPTSFSVDSGRSGMRCRHDVHAGSPWSRDGGEASPSPVSTFLSPFRGAAPVLTETPFALIGSGGRARGPAGCHAERTSKWGIGCRL